MSATRAYARFLAAGGGRVALRALAVGGMGAVALVVFDPEPIALLRRIARGVAGVEHDPAIAVLPALIAVAATQQTARRLLLGSSGWVRHLPVTAIARRRAAWLATLITEAPVALALCACAAFAYALDGRVSLWKLAGWPSILAGASLLALPTARRALAGLLCVGGIVCAASTVPLATLLAPAVVWLADRIAGPLAATRSARPRRSGTPRLFDARITARAVTWRVLDGVPAAGLVGAALYFFLRNNALGAATAHAAARGVAPVVVGLCLGPFADAILVHRPAWPWVRSLPRTSRSRVAVDATLLAVPAALLGAGLAFVHPAAALSALSAMPLLACVGAGAVRVGARRRLGATGEVLLAALLAGALSGAHVLGCIACLAAAPPACAWAAAREARLKPSRWIELHHDPAGDTLSWSSR